MGDRLTLPRFRPLDECLGQELDHFLQSLRYNKRHHERSKHENSFMDTAHWREPDLQRSTRHQHFPRRRFVLLTPLQLGLMFCKDRDASKIQAVVCIHGSTHNEANAIVSLTERSCVTCRRVRIFLPMPFSSKFQNFSSLALASTCRRRVCRAGARHAYPRSARPTTHRSLKESIR